MKVRRYFSATYAEARQKFLEAARGAGASVKRATAQVIETISAGVVAG